MWFKKIVKACNVELDGSIEHINIQSHTKE